MDITIKSLLVLQLQGVLRNQHIVVNLTKTACYPAHFSIKETLGTESVNVISVAKLHSRFCIKITEQVRTIITFL